MKAVFLPYFDENPYQANLARELERRGVAVFRASGYPLSTLRTLLRCGVPDVLHLHWLSPFLLSDRYAVSVLKSAAFLAAVVCAKLLGVRVVWTAHNALEHERRHPGLERFVRRQLVRHLFDDVVVHCRRAGDVLAEEYGLAGDLRATVVPHGNYVRSYDDRIGRDDARRRLGLSDDATVALYFGLIRPYKQVPHLVETFGNVDDEDARLVVAGKPDTEAAGRAVRERAGRDDRVTAVLEFVPADEVQVYMNAADVVVLPYSDILSSGSVLLAMSFGKAVVAPDAGCVGRVVGDRAGFLYDPADEDGLETALREAFDADLRAAGRRAYRRAEGFDWASIADRTREVYEATEAD